MQLKRRTRIECVSMTWRAGLVDGARDVLG
jgi:hypothetical protein